MPIPEKLDLVALEGAAKKCHRLCSGNKKAWCKLTKAERSLWNVIASETICTYFNDGKDLDEECC